MALGKCEGAYAHERIESRWRWESVEGAYALYQMTDILSAHLLNDKRINLPFSSSANHKASVTAQKNL